LNSRPTRANRDGSTGLVLQNCRPGQVQDTLIRSKILLIYRRAKIITKRGAAFHNTSGEPAAVSVLWRSGLNYAANAKLSSTFIFLSDSFTGCYRLSPTCSFRPSSRRRNLSPPIKLKLKKFF